MTTDTHFGHRFLVQACGRPEDFEERIARNWAAVVLPEDMVIHLGDIQMKSTDAYVHEKYIKALPGRKVLIRGNHDRKSAAWYCAHGWDSVWEAVVMELYGQRILFTHEPAPLPTSEGGAAGLWTINIHGHLHNTTHHHEYADQHRHPWYLLALEWEDYRPVLLRTFLQQRRLA